MRNTVLKNSGLTSIASPEPTEPEFPLWLVTEPESVTVVVAEGVPVLAEEPLPWGASIAPEV